MSAPLPRASTGLVDIHCHGAVGHEFGHNADGSREAIRYHREHGGVQTLVASLVSVTPEALLSQVRTLAPLVAEGELAGIHLEGPFLSEKRRGAHDPKVLTDPNLHLVDSVTEACAESGVPQAILQWTFAPERPGAEEFIAALARSGILPAVGHTASSATEVTRTLGEIADRCGRKPLITHLFNGMPSFHHRDGGPVAAALASASRSECFVELIGDGVHVAPEVVRMVFDTVGAEHIALVSDAMSATGLGNGRYVLGGLEVDVSDRVARLDDGTGNGSIAGSTSTLGECVRWVIEVAGVNEADVLIAATTTPSEVLNLTR